MVPGYCARLDSRHVMGRLWYVDLWQDLSTQSSTDGALKPAKEVNSTIEKFFAADNGDDKTLENLLPGFKVKQLLHQYKHQGSRRLLY